MATEKQVKCVFALTKKLNLPFEYGKIKKMSLEETSNLIDDLKDKISHLAGDTTTTNLNTFSPVTFGLCVKLVYNANEAIYPDKRLFEVMGKKVKELYNFVVDLEREMKKEVEQ